MPSLLYESDGVDHGAGFGGKPGFGFAYGNDCPLGVWTSPDFEFAGPHPSAYGSVGAWGAKPSEAAATNGVVFITLASDDDYQSQNIGAGSPIYRFAGGGPVNSIVVSLMPGDVYVPGSGADNPVPFLFLGNRVQTAVGSFTPNLTTGAQAITGLGFLPDLILFVGHGLGGDGNGARMMFGAVDADGNQFVNALIGIAESGPTILGGVIGTVTRTSEFRKDACILGLQDDYGLPSSTLTARQRCSWASMDADGFTINVDEVVGAGGAGVVGYVALKLTPGHGAAAVRVGTEGDTDFTGMGFLPEAVILCSNNQAAADQATNTIAAMCLGAYDGALARSTIVAAGSGASTPVDFYDDTLLSLGDTDAQTVDTEFSATLDADGVTLGYPVGGAGGRDFGLIALWIDNGGEPVLRNGYYIPAPVMVVGDPLEPDDGDMVPAEGIAIALDTHTLQSGQEWSRLDG